MKLNKTLEEKIRRNHYYFQKLDKNIREDKDSVLYLLMVNPDIYYLLDDNLSMDLEVITKAVFVKPDIIRNVRKDILLDKKVSKKLFEINPLSRDIYEELGIINKVHISSFPKHIFDYLVRLECSEKNN